MAKAKEEESIRLSALQGQVVGSFEIPCNETKPQIPLHLLAGVQEHSFGEAAAQNY